MVSPERVLFVLGAGSHIPYGFPSSYDLLKEIEEMLSFIRSNKHLFTVESKEVFLKFYRNGNIEARELAELDQEESIVLKKIYGMMSLYVNIVFDSRNSQYVLHNYSIESQCSIISTVFCAYTNEFENIVEASPGSVDEYLLREDFQQELHLQQHIPLMDVHIKLISPLKVALLYLLSFKQKEILNMKRLNADWIQKLLSMMFRGYNQNEKYPKFVTFNYDTYLEYRFFKYLKNIVRLNEKEANKVIEEINIHHVYGKVCEEWIDSYRLYPVNIDDIKTIGAERGEVNLEVVIEKDIELIVFLGFGFDATNINTLFANLFKGKEQKVYAISTNIGLSSHQQKHYTSELLRYNIALEFVDVKTDSLSLIRDSLPIHNRNYFII